MKVSRLGMGDQYFETYCYSCSKSVGILLGPHVLSNLRVLVGHVRICFSALFMEMKTASSYFLHRTVFFTRRSSRISCCQTSSFLGVIQCWGKDLKPTALNWLVSRHRLAYRTRQTWGSLHDPSLSFEESKVLRRFEYSWSLDDMWRYQWYWTIRCAS